MRTMLALTAAAMLLVLPLSAAAQNAALPDVAAALGAAGLKSLEYSGSGVQFQAGQSAMPPSPFTLNFVDNLKRLGLNVDRLLPLHGRLVPIADLHTAAGHGQ